MDLITIPHAYAQAGLSNWFCPSVVVVITRNLEAIANNFKAGGNDSNPKKIDVCGLVEQLQSWFCKALYTTYCGHIQAVGVTDCCTNGTNYTAL